LAKALVITEKPSVARDIAAALGGFEDHDGWLESEDYVVSFAVGHLFELLSPEEVDEKYKRWTLDVLPIVPERFELKKKKGHSERIRTLKKLVERADVDRVVNACDAGREGELIFREIVRFLGVQKPIQRLWLQSMTATAIQRGFQKLLPGEQMEGLAQAAECRAYADWLIGMNATRALTKRFASKKEKTAWSAGRVQTPTLALLVDRELRVLAHVPQPYWRVEAHFEHQGSRYVGSWFDPGFQSRMEADEQHKDDRIFAAARAAAVAQAVQGQAGLASETRKPAKESAPPLFDLTSLQREGNRRFGWSARRTLGAAQRCYEAHKLLTYPRTDSRCLPADYRATVDDVLRRLGSAAGLPQEVRAGARRLLEDGRQNEGRIFNDAGVSDHFAIIPTGNLPPAGLKGDDARLYDLVLRRFLGAFHPPAVWERVERTTVVAGEHFRTRARTVMEPGWRAVLPAAKDEDAPVMLPPLDPGSKQVSDVAVVTAEASVLEQETRPPPRISEGRLLSLMENAGQQVEDEDLAAVLHEKGLGTPATRAETIENLIRKGYVVRVGKALRPTVKGIRLIDSLRRIEIDRLASPALTGQLEQHLLEVEHGTRSGQDFMEEITAYAVEVVERAKTFAYEELYHADPPIGTCPFGGRPVVERAWFYTCLKDDDLPRDAKADPSCPQETCPLLLWKDTSGRYLDRAAAQALLRDGRTRVLDGFTARNGRTYKGHLEIDADEGKVKVISEGWNEDRTSDVPEYEVNTDPLGPCPFGEDAACQVIETATHFSCAKRLESEELDVAFKAAKRLAKEQGQPAPHQPKKPEKPEHCGFVLPRTVCKREMTREECLDYMKTGRTELLEDFTSRFGRPFSATLVLKENGRHGFEFPPRKGRGAAAGGDAAPARKKVTPRKKAGRKKQATPRKKPARKKTAKKRAPRKAPRRRPGNASD